MLTVRPVKNIQGKINLPPDPDLFMLVTVIALVRQRSVCVQPAVDLPVLRDWAQRFERLLTFEWSAEKCRICPVTDDPSIRVPLPSPADLPWREYIVFALLGNGKTVVVPATAEKRCTAWREQAKRLGCELTVEPLESSLCCTLVEVPSAIRGDLLPEETDISALLGLLLGCGGTHTFTVSGPLSSPLRTAAPVFGYTLESKSSIARELDPVSRRIQFMRQKNRRTTAPSSTQQFTVTADFSIAPDGTDEELTVTLPGDATTGALLTEAKCLFPKNALVIGNVPLESWATLLLPFIRKMGCKVSVQETGRTSFGSVGILHLQSTGLVGRKIECIPAAQYVPFLPAMVIIAAFSKGESVLRELADLRNDEPDGIATIEACIRTLGAHHGEMPDGIVLKGGNDFDGFDLELPLNAPCAAAFSIAGLHCTGNTTINDALLRERFPEFEQLLTTIGEQRT